MLERKCFSGFAFLSCGRKSREKLCQRHVTFKGMHVILQISFPLCYILISSIHTEVLTLVCMKQVNLLEALVYMFSDFFVFLFDET